MPPDFSRLTATHRRILDLRVRGWSIYGVAGLLNVKHSTVARRMKHITKLMGVRTVYDALEAWRNHPNRQNDVLWDVVDTLRKEARKVK